MTHALHTLRRYAVLMLAGVGLVLTPLPAVAQLPTVEVFTVEYAINQILVKWIKDQFLNMVMKPFQAIIGTFIDSGTNSIGSAIMKEVAADSQLLQAQMNYKAVLWANERATQAFNRFASSSSYAYGTCETAATNEGAGNVQVSTRIAIKATTAADTAYDLYNASASQAQLNITDLHNTTYCSQGDATAGRGCTPVAPHMQNADVSAGTLLVPNGGNTYTPEEYQAATAYVRMVTAPVPQEMIPVGMEKTPQGMRFVVGQRAAAAQMSVARLALNQIKESNAKANNLTNTVAGPAGDLSISALMQKIVTERFGNANYAASLQVMNETGLLKEIAINLTTANWQAYQTYLMNEPAELVAATQTAIVARADAERRLGELRANMRAVNR